MTSMAEQPRQKVLNDDSTPRSSLSFNARNTTMRTACYACSASGMRLLLLLLAAPSGVADDGSPYPVRSGNNRISWPNGCCEGDLIVIDFRDFGTFPDLGAELGVVRDDSATGKTSWAS